MAVLERTPRLTVGEESNGMLMTPREFDRADFDELWQYELINGVLVVTPLPFNAEVDPNQYLGYLLLHYQDFHPQGSALDVTLPEQHVRCGSNRRRADRVIWAGLKRKPRKRETPTIVVDFVSKRKRDRHRDYVVKREEYGTLGVKEYWVFDRFERTLTVFSRAHGRAKSQVVREDQIYRTPLLPGFELPVKVLLARAEYWANEESEVGLEDD